MSGPAKRGASMINDFTTGSIPRAMLRFSVPFMFSNVLQIVYSLVDMAVVGQFVGKEGLSAVSIASQVCNFMAMFSLGFSTSGQVYISQLIGAGRKEELNRTIGTLFTLLVGICAFMMALGFFLHRQVLGWLNAPEEAFSMAVDYVLVCTSGLIFTYGYNMLSAVLRGMGDSKRPFLFILIASIVNLVLDLIFVPVFNWGVAGAALATIIGQAASFLFAVVYLYRRRESFGFDFKLKSLIPDRPTVKRLTTVGIPFALRSCAINISMMFVGSLVNSLGVTPSAVFGTGVKLDDIINKLTMGISYATSAMVGQNIGADKPERAKKVVWWSIGFSLAAYGIFTAVYIPCCKGMFGFFTDDAEVIALAPVFVSAIVWSFPAMAVMHGTSGFINGIGNSRLSFALALFDGFVMRIALSYLLGVVMGHGLFGFFLGYGLAAYGSVVPAFIYFLSGRWRDYSLLKKKEAPAEGA